MTQHDYGLNIASVALRVNDLDKVAGFYKSTVGLSLLRQDGETALLGAGDVPVLELQRDAHAKRQPSAPGLFHTAFLLPQRSDLGAWMAMAAAHNIVAEGASDHGVSEAVYLADPEGNGVEIYADRVGGTLGQTGNIGRIDFDDLMARATHWAGMPTRATIGHVHLQVGNISAADSFFVDTLGLDEMNKMGSMAFYSAGGYHHHFGANTHRSRGVDRPDGKAAGLVSVDLELASFIGLPAQVEAPWGTQFNLRERAALAA